MRLKPLLILLSGIIIGFILSFFYFELFQLFDHNADGADLILEVHDIIANHNIFLKGWVLVTDSFYGLDILFFIIAVKILGVNPLIMSLVPAVIYSLLIILLISINFKLNDKKNCNLGLILILLFAVIPSKILIPNIGMSPIHILTLLLSLIIFLIFSHKKINSTYYFAVILLLCVNIGDPMSYFITSLPILLSAYLMIRQNIALIKNKIHIRIVMICFIISVIFDKTISQYGFQLHRNVKLGIASFPDVIHHIIYYTQNFLWISQASIFGQQSLLNIDFILSAACFVIINIAILRLYKTIEQSCIKNSLFEFNEKDNLKLFLCLAFTVNILACFFTSTFYAFRYLLPAFFYIILFIVLDFPERIQAYKLNFMYLILSILIALKFALFLIYNINIYQHHKKLINNTKQQVLNYLEKNQLFYGYGGYWDANLLTVMSSYKIKIRPIESDNENNLMRFCVFNKDKWYVQIQNKNPHFFVWSDDFDDDKNLSKKLIALAGTPDIKINLGTQHIDIWHKNISAYIKINIKTK